LCFVFVYLSHPLKWKKGARGLELVFPSCRLLGCGKEGSSPCSCQRPGDFSPGSHDGLVKLWEAKVQNRVVTI
jgi:hypothetical protein